ncbi:hypothetical protein MUK42_13997 [Musa troglodytarum]|uniref:Uncharacterized protein n=1 Tax=Musa troglodytarum TaxID=320322 RepID=A0A9E7H4U2_9LILI|nr:hypothetical protein MUK42_13997 [Musa troglodytarum]
MRPNPTRYLPQVTLETAARDLSRRNAAAFHRIALVYCAAAVHFIFSVDDAGEFLERFRTSPMLDFLLSVLRLGR